MDWTMFRLMHCFNLTGPGSEPTSSLSVKVTVWVSDLRYFCSEHILREALCMNMSLPRADSIKKSVTQFTHNTTHFYAIINDQVESTWRFTADSLGVQSRNTFRNEAGKTQLCLPFPQPASLTLPITPSYVPGANSSHLAISGMSFKREGEEPHMCLLKSRTSLCRSCLFFAADPSTGPNSTLIGWVLVKGMDHLTLVQLPMAEKSTQCKL